MRLAVVFALAAAAAQLAAQRPASPPSPLSSYPPVTTERLIAPADGEWLMIRRTYNGWGYSPLDEITPANVGRLRPVWVFSTDTNSGHEAAPVVNGGVMFVSTPGGQALAIDVRTGTLLWKASLGGQIVNGPITYMVDGKQYLATIAGHSLVAFALRD